MPQPHEQLVDVDGHPYVHGDRMSRRQYFSHGGPGWDFCMHQPDYNWRTGEVESDVPWPPREGDVPWPPREGGD